MSLNDFVNKYTGQPRVGDTPENTGQCVGLIEVWLDNIGSPHIWGNAKDLPANAGGAYQVSHGGIPQPGDIFCFDGYYGNGAGHTGIVLKADRNQVTLFQQNDPEGSFPHAKVYSYTHMAGFIHPKVLINQGDEMTNVDRNMAIDLGVGILGRTSEAAAGDQGYLNSVVGQPVDAVIRNLVNSAEGKAFRARAASQSQPTTLSPGTYKVN